MTLFRSVDLKACCAQSVGALSLCALIAGCGNAANSHDGGAGASPGSGASAGVLSGGSANAGGTAGASSGAATSSAGNATTGGSAVASGGAGGTETGDGIGRYTVLEIEVPFSESGLTNVWEDVTVTAVFTSPSNETITVKGFYDSTDTWKVRFAPWEVGTYSYHIAIASTSSDDAVDGSFDCVDKGEKGFIRASEQNPFRLVFEGDGGLYNALGIGNCFDDPDGPNWGLDGGDTTQGEAQGHADGETYLTAMADVGKLNLFRWSVNNCAPDMWETLSPAGNTYLEKESKWGDRLVQLMRDHGVRVYLDMFGWQPAFAGQWQDQPSMDAVKRYVDYMVARYGAYVDFWEVCNESSPPTEWISLVAAYVESIDPYHHMVSVSYEHPELDAIDIASPHWYEREAELDSDTGTVAKIEAQRYAGKPIIFGEQGNSVQNWDPLSDLRARIRTWTAFFDEGYFIFWDQQGSKNYQSGAANLYIGEELRGYFAVLQTYTAAVPADVTRTDVASAPGGAVRTYGLESASGFYVYLRDAQGYSNARSGVTLSMTLAKAGTAKFYDTTTGAELSSAAVAAGAVTVNVPDFVADTALAITYD